ncbi:MAG: gfo/Idh/MocA family oxidoreductase [Pirellulaceae bacterium]
MKRYPFLLIALFCSILPVMAEEPLKVGIIGLDTSHVIAFTKTMNDPKAEGDLAKMNVTAAFPGGSPDIASSRDRVEGFTNQLRDMGVEIVDSIPALLEKVDAIMLESVDGRPHLRQALPVFKAGKRLYIDKPLAASLVDAMAIEALSQEHNVPWFSSSSLRFSPEIHRFRDGDPKVGAVRGAVVWSPCSLDPTHPDLFWYGIHGVETLYTIMGAGCTAVTRVSTDGTDQATGVWKDGRVGTFRGIRDGKSGYGGIVFGEKSIADAGTYAGYKPLVERIASFFLTGEVPVQPSETIELIAFMTAADVSKEKQGASVSIESVMQEAKEKVADRIAEVEKESN